MTETVPFSKLSDKWKRDPAFATEYLAACLEDGDPAVVANGVRSIMRSRGEEAADEPTLADFMALTKALGLAVRVEPIQHVAVE